ncbi:solute carrier family 22 member 1-like isoform X1 [Clavelina lepadiformis]|uniref:solute carrier family 22 member 1-like isoform X1 n=1 Tax=Clavelina lepadiformis TaxID=159417 RepID=UPI0040418E69
MMYEQLMKHVGEFGSCQKFIAAATCMGYYVIGLFLLYSVFILYTPPHQCNFGGANNFSSNGSILEMESNFDSSNENKTFSNSNLHCDDFVKKHDYNQPQERCRVTWKYNTEKGITSVATEFGLVCERAWMKPLIQSIQIGGVMAGSLLGGIISDRIGRRRTIIPVAIILVISDFLLVIMPSIYGIQTFIFFLGFASAILSTTYVVILHEYTPAHELMLLAFFQMSCCSFGYATMSLLQFLFPNWRHMTIATGVLASLMLLPTLFVSETVRWSLENQSTKKTFQLLKKIAEINKVDLSDTQVMTMLINAEETKRNESEKNERNSNYLKIQSKFTDTYLDLIKVPILRKRILALGFAWFAACLAYYAFGFNTDNLGISRYLGACLSALMEVPGDVISFFMVRRIGKVKTFVTVSLSSGILFLLTAGLQKVNVWAGAVSAMFGKLFSTIMYSLVLVSAADFFPTSLRNQAFAVCYCIGRFGSLFSPFVVFLGENVFEIFPFILMSVVVFAAAICFYLLPETSGRPLPSTMRDAVMLER